MQPAPRQLFEEVSLGPVRLRNRTLRAAAFEGMSEGHLVTERLIDYHRQVARGGVGMTTVAYAAVDKSGLSFPHQLWMRPEAVPGLRRLTDAVHAEGARASIQIGHTGNMAKRAVSGERPLAPSARPSLFGLGLPRAMRTDELSRLPHTFARAVELARDAGFDAVEVHGGHGYLLSQFLSPWTNRRTDAYGGSLAGRMRLLREVVGRVRQAAGNDLAVLVKMNLFDGFEGGCDLGEAIELARALEEEGAHALVLSGGFVSRTPMHVMRGAMPTRVMSALVPDRWLRLGLRLFGQALIRPVPYEENYFFQEALEVRRHVRLPLVYVGGATSRAGIDRLLAAGFDCVAIARALIREPDFVERLRDPAHVSPCDHCNYCAARIYTSSMACHQLEPPPPAVARFVTSEGVR